MKFWLARVCGLFYMALSTLKPRIKTLGNRVAPRIDLRPDGSKLSPSARGYDSRWIKAREGFLRKHPLCQCPDCDEGRKKLTIADEVDHVIPHRGNMVLFWDSLNWQALAKKCHARKTWLETHGDGREIEYRELRIPSDLAPSRIPCVMVCGPPNGGKHPYVSQHACNNDTVIDMDQITPELSGLPVWASGLEWLNKALTERNKRLRALARDTTHDRAWFLINAPNPRERGLWARMLGAKVAMLAPPLDECIRRIHAEPYHEGYTERMAEAAQDWWSRNATVQAHRDTNGFWIGVV